MIDGRWFRWVRRRFGEAIRDNAWLLPAIGALTGFVLAQIVSTEAGDDPDGWTVTVDRSRDSLLAGLGLVFTAFSIVLALASVAAQNVVGRFGSRTLHIYIREGADRWVIGSFALASAFILTEQFQLRKLDPHDPAPVAGLTISIVLLIVNGRRDWVGEHRNRLATVVVLAVTLVFFVAAGALHVRLRWS